MGKKIIIIIFISIVCIGAGYLVARELSHSNQIVSQAPITNAGAGSDQNQAAVTDQTASVTGNNQAAQKILPPSTTLSKKIEQRVPFVVQAPFGNWSNPIFQNACEEAGVVMAMGWINNSSTISPTDTQSQIQKIVNFENKTFKYSADTDLYDMEKIFQEYFQYQNITVRENITISDIKNELQKGSIILVPAFGQALDNPNYTSPGPIAHMLVIIGYDPATKEFITNDPGTKHGSGYRYDENVLFSAIWEYPSGANSPQAPSGVMKKGMLVVQPK